MDLYLYSFDCSLRIQFSFLAGQVFARHEWLGFAGMLFYIASPLALALVYAANLRVRNKAAFFVMLAFLVTGPIGVLFYNLVPATEPVQLFGQNFPWQPLSPSQAMNLMLETLPVKGPRSAIPSLHMAWVLLIWWNSKGLARWIRVVALAFVILTVLATLGTGEHYFVDLVAAFPFGLMVQALWRCASIRAVPARLAAHGIVVWYLLESRLDGGAQLCHADVLDFTGDPLGDGDRDNLRVESVGAPLA